MYQALAACHLGRRRSADRKSAIPPSTPAQALAALHAGELVILPTETVYGLAADARNGEAVARLFEAKGRPRFNPLIVHVADLDGAETVAVLDARARAVGRAAWPGPLTLVLPARAGAVSDLARAGLDTVAVRVPAHPIARDLLAAFGGPVVAPSANRSGRPSPTTFADACEETGAAAAAALDGGACAVGVESTVVLLPPDGPARLLRPGGLPRAELEALVGPLAAEDAADGARSPGRLARHYAPRAPVRLDVTTPRPGEAFLAFGSAPDGPLAWSLSASGDLREAAARLFALLREADRAHPVAIAVAPVPDHGLGEAINDRLRRAAGHVG